MLGFFLHRISEACITYTHFQDEKTETQKDKVTCLRPHSIPIICPSSLMCCSHLPVVSLGLLFLLPESRAG